MAVRVYRIIGYSNLYAPVISSTEAHEQFP